VDRERVHAAGKFARKCGVDHAMALDPALSEERIRHDIDPEMRFPARPVAGMAFMAVGFVNHPQAFGGESLGQSLCDDILDRHGRRLDRPMPPGQPQQLAGIGRLGRQSLQPRWRSPHNERL
jgi:hypothetical protein